MLIAPLDPQGKNNNWPNPSLAILSLKAYIKRYFPEIAIFTHDLQINDADLLFQYRDQKIDIVGISALQVSLKNTIDFFTQWSLLHPESLLVAGGIGAAVNYHELFDRSPCDIIVLGAGEEPLKQIISWKNGALGLEQINGIIFRHQPQRLTNAQYWAQWKDIDFAEAGYHKYWQQAYAQRESGATEDSRRIKHVRLVTVSGCNRTCLFCSTTLNSKGNVVYLSGEQIYSLVNKVLGEVQDLESIYFVTDDIFWPTKKPFYEFAALWLKSGNKTNFLIQSSVESVQESDFELFAHLGVWRVTLGIENCSERMLQSLKKRVDLTKINTIINWSQEYNVALYFLIILFPPEMTLTDAWINYIQSQEWIQKGITISVEPVVRVYRGTPIYFMDYETIYSFADTKDAYQLFKFPEYLLPRDPLARKLVMTFKEQENKYVIKSLKYERLDHTTKGDTGKILIKLLGNLLKEFDPLRIYCPENLKEKSYEQPSANINHNEIA